MGYFNKVGFYSNLPIKYSDEIVYFICASYGKVYDVNQIESSEIIEPICLPIFGRYNDYGSIDEIICDDNVKTLEKTFDLPIHVIISSIEEGSFCVKGESKDMEYEMILSKLLDSQFIKDKDKISLCVTMEHKSVYDTMSSLFRYKEDEIEKRFDDVIESLKDYKEYINIFNHNKHTYDVLKIIQIQSKKIDENLSEDELLRTLSEDELKEWSLYKNEKIRDYKLLFKLDSFETYSSIKDFYFSMFMYNIVEIDYKALKGDIITFLNFNKSLRLMCGKYVPSSYGYQALTEFKCEFLKLHECYDKIIKDLNPN